MEIINKVANSGLISFDLEAYYQAGERIIYDFKDNLFMGLVLKEKDFREFLKNHDWTQYADKKVAICCTADAIVPTWAYMLFASHLENFCKDFVFGDLEMLETQLFLNSLSKIDFSIYQDARVVVKGCSNIEVPTAIYVEITKRLKPYVKSLMFGEPCSTVPIYKVKKP